MKKPTAGKKSVRRLGLPGAKLRNKSHYVEMPPLVSGTKGPNYVARAMRPGGYAQGGGVTKDTRFYSYGSNDGDHGKEEEKPVVETKMGASTGVRRTGILGALQAGKVQQGENPRGIGGARNVGPARNRIRSR